MKYEIIILNNKNKDSCLNLDDNKKVIVLTNKYYYELKEFKKDFFMLDFARITTNNTFIFATDYDNFNFKDFEIESNIESYEGIKWRNRNLINIGDIVYIYFFNLPDKLSRIMAKAIVIDDGFHYSVDGLTNNELCKIDDEDKKNTAIRIKQICIFDDDESRIRFNKNRLASAPYFIKLSHYCPKISIDNQDKLIKELENYIDNYKLNSKVSYYAKHFGLECFFKDYPEKDFFEYNHKTFIKENGNSHYIIHHLIEQHNARNKIVDDDFVYNTINEIVLCPNCHDRIHRGRYEDRKKMILYIYKNRKKELDEKLSKIPQKVFNNVPKNILNKKLFWLLRQYVPEKYIKEEDLK